MIHHRQSRWIFASLLLVFGLSARAAWGQLLPAQLINAPGPFAPAERAQIDAFVSREADKLRSPETVALVASGRGTLILPGPLAQATPAFWIEYADSLNQKLLEKLPAPLAKYSLATHPDARVRLNAAIVAAKIAGKALNGKLAPVTDIFLKDKNPAVILWGLQSAKIVVPELLTDPATIPGSPNMKLALSIGDATVQAAKEYANDDPSTTPSASFIEEAYRTVCLKPSLGGGSVNIDLKPMGPPSLQAFLPLPMALFEARVKQYQTMTPPQPATDAWCANFFVSQFVWKAATKSQQDQIMQMMLDLLKGASMQYAATRPRELLELIQQTGSAFQVIGDGLPTGGAVAGKDFKDTAHGVATLNPNSGPAEIDAAIAKVEELVNKIK